MDEETSLRDALWWADMTTSPDRVPVALDERIEVIQERYGLQDGVTFFNRQAESELRGAVERTEVRSRAAGYGPTKSAAGLRMVDLSELIVDDVCDHLDTYVKPGGTELGSSVEGRSGAGDQFGAGRGPSSLVAWSSQPDDRHDRRGGRGAGPSRRVGPDG
jgi:hypothetical protein